MGFTFSNFTILLCQTLYAWAPKFFVTDPTLSQSVQHLNKKLKCWPVRWLKFLYFDAKDKSSIWSKALCYDAKDKSWCRIGKHMKLMSNKPQLLSPQKMIRLITFNYCIQNWSVFVSFHRRFRVYIRCRLGCYSFFIFFMEKKVWSFAIFYVNTLKSFKTSNPQH